MKRMLVFFGCLFAMVALGQVVPYNTTNTNFGTSAAPLNTGTGSTAIGASALAALTSGNYNTAVGNSALAGITTSPGNTAVGTNALLNNVPTGGNGYSVAVGNGAGQGLTTGNAVTLVGDGVGYSGLTSATAVVALGASTNCITANTSNVIYLCAAAGPIYTATGANTPSTSVTTIAGVIAVSGITTDATHTDATVCEDTTSHQFYFGSGTLGICLGTSSARFKHDIQPLALGLKTIEGLKPVRYKLNRDHGDPDKPLYGFTAEEMQTVAPELVGLDTHGRPNTADYVGLIPVLVKAMQEQQQEIRELKRRHAR